MGDLGGACGRASDASRHQEAISMRGIGVISVVVLLLLPWTAQAATYWANPSDQGLGNCSSSANACDLQQGLNTLGSGDTLILKSGSYTGVGLNPLNNFIVPSSATGTSGSKTIIRVDDAANVTIRRGFEYHANHVHLTGAHGMLMINGDNELAPTSFVPEVTCATTFTPTNAFYSGFGGEHLGIIFERFEVAYSACDIFGLSGDTQYLNLHVHHAGIRPDGSYIDGLARGYVHGTYHQGNGVVVDGGTWHTNDGYSFHRVETGQSNWTIRNVRMYGNTNGGIILAGGGHKIYNNLIRDNFGECIVSSGEMYNNTIINNGNCGMRLNGQTVRNNIFFNNGGGCNFSAYPDTSFQPGAFNNVSHNLCESSASSPDVAACGGSNQVIEGNAENIFVSASQKDFRLKAGSPAIDQGTNLAFLFTQDIEGKTRALPFDIGAYELGEVTEPPEPVGLVGEWKLDTGSGTTAVNTAAATLGTQDGTLNSTGWTVPGLIGNADLATNGARWVAITPSATMHAITDAFGISAWWKGSGAGGGENGCEVFTDANSRILRIDPDGRLSCLFHHAAGWRYITSTTGNLFDNNAHHVSCSLQSGADGLRARIDNASVGQVATSETVSFLGGQAFIGRHPDDTSYHCGTGTIGNVYVFDGYLSDSGNTNLFQEYIPLGGVSGIHVQWRADDPLASIQGSLDTPISWTIGNTLIQEWYISNNSGSQVVAHYPQFCSRNGGAYTQVTNTSQSTIGVQVATSTNANMGDSVTPAQNFGLTPVDGRDVVDTVAEAQTTLPHGGVTAWRYYMSFGGVAAANDTYRCKPYKPFTSPAVLDHYFDDVEASIPLITLQSPATVGSGVKSGGVNQGGKRQ
jgi:Concanavalin A-like lectin/glucanases superfamily